MTDLSTLPPPPLWLAGSPHPKDEIVLSTRVRLVRNIENFPFPASCLMAQRTAVFEEVSAKLLAEDACSGFTLVNLLGMAQQEQQLLWERRDISLDLLRSEGDRGALFDAAGTTGILINDNDHVRVQVTGAGFTPRETWMHADRLDDILGSRLNYLYDPRWGFLASNPSAAGCGLRIFCLLHLPGLVLTRQIEQVLLGASHMGIASSTFWGEGALVVGNMFLLSHQAVMGCSESEAVATVEQAVGAVVEAERAAREKMAATALSQIDDKVSRAWGIMLHARLMTMDELFNLASVIRTGIALGLFKRIDLPTLNRMVLVCQPAHLQHYCGTRVDAAGIDRQRARMVQALIRPRRRPAA